MGFWLATISAFIAAVAAGIIIRVVIRRRDRVGTSGVDLRRSNLEDTEIESSVKVKGRSDVTDLGNISVSKSKLARTKIKSKTSTDE